MNTRLMRSASVNGTSALKSAMGIKEVYYLLDSTRGFQTEPEATFLANFRKAALERGISTNHPSDLLDMSRDICINEAAGKMGCDWEIHHGLYGTYLCLTPFGFSFDWKRWIEDQAEGRAMAEKGKGKQKSDSPLKEWEQK